MTRLMYDSVNPNAIPADAEMVAGYIDGTSFKWSESDWNRFTKAVRVRIARRVYTNDGHVLDVESGIPTVWPPTQRIVDWVVMRRNSGVEPTIYCNQLNDWPTIRLLFQNARVREPQWWVARYNNISVIPIGAIAKQYANPPLAGGHYDLSVVADYWPGVDGDNDMALDAQERNALFSIYNALFKNSAGELEHPTQGDQSIITRLVELQQFVRDLADRPTLSEAVLAEEMARLGIGGVTVEQVRDLLNALVLRVSTS